MKIFSRILPLLLLAFAGCISNDIPYPVIKGEVLAFAVEGQKEDPVISKDKRLIEVVLNDNVDIRSVAVKTFKITKDASTDFDPGQPVNLTNKVEFTIETYQSYEWTIQATQPIEREVHISGQIGTAIIDVPNRSVYVKVPESQDMSNITIEKLVLGSSISTMTPDIAAVTDFRWPQKFTVKYFDITEEWTVSIQHSNEVVTTLAGDPWAKFANLSGAIQTGTSDTPGFDYRKASETDWTSVPDERVQVTGGAIMAKLGGLTPGTAYVYRARLGDATGEEVAFTTEAASLIPNMDMNSWSQVISGSKITDNPWAEGQDPYWITGNKGVTIYKSRGNTIPDTDSHEGTAARLETLGNILVVGLAAGNLFTGDFITNITDPIKSTKFGRPYTGRPTSISFWYKYSPKTIDYAKADKGGEIYLGQTDQCHIYIYLEDWHGATERPATPDVIASGEFKSDALQAAYTQSNINIVYRDKTRKPTHIVLVATSSIYGDLFTGGIGSVLYVDDFQFGFD